MRDDKIIRRCEARARGVTDSEVRRLVRTGAWIRLGSGVYIPSDIYTDADERDRHVYRALAAMEHFREGVALSHVSAAMLHGLETWQISLDVVHVTRNRSGGSRRGSGCVLHSSKFTEDEVTPKDSVRVLSVARTITDLASTLSFEQAVVVGDRALRIGTTTLDELKRAVERMGRHPGRAKAARAVRLMSDRSDSVGESRSRVLMIGAQLPIPEEQPDVFDANGRWLARVDFLLPEHGVIGEFDGRIKYRRDGVATTEAEDVVFQEKLREDRLRHAGWVVVRWTWADLQTPDTLVARIREGIALAARGSGPVGTFDTRKLAGQM
ncbi:type IV toxin-antitoxin system AbiEi family antitoxin domain-containing protein [Rhodococcus sp. NPDC060086]|uniref:type IV toxin-antitoxin system AbiEi family antitoxin domain-containing protein n=1 Tax=Rhodococcus sp. NPDC060086 TaxID=3347055 RepID=UPI00364BF9EC